MLIDAALLQFLIIFQVACLIATELLIFFSSSKIAGLGFSQGQMALFLAIRPVCLLSWEMTVFPRMSKRYGLEKVVRVLIWGPPFVNAIYLLLSFAITSDAASTSVVITLLAAAMLVQTVSNPVFLSVDCLVAARTPTESQLSTMNAVAEVIGQIAIGVGASFGSTLFAWSVVGVEGFWQGKMVWLAMIVTALGTALHSQRLTHIPGWRERAEQQELDEE